MNKRVSPKKIEIYAKRLYDRRIEKGYNQENLAKLAHTTKQNLSDIENGKLKSINTEILKELAKNLDCTEDYLIGNSDIPYKSAPVNGKAGTETIIPIEYEYPGAEVKNRLFELYGDNITQLGKLVTFLEKSDESRRKIFIQFIDSCIDLIKYEEEKNCCDFEQSTST